jgi:Ca2+-binding RTX toxin-like protein
MVLQVVTGVDVGAGLRVDLTTTDDLFIARNAIVGTTGTTYAITGDGSGHAVEIEGTVVGIQSIIRLGDSLTDSSQKLFVAEGALVSAVDGQPSTGSIFVQGDGSLVDNRGTIRTSGALTVAGDTPTNPITVFNRGVIETEFFAVTAFATPTVDLFNTGVIRVINPAGFGYSGSAGVDRLTNSGVISGKVRLDAADDRYDGRGGGTVGEVSGEEGSDTLLGGSAAETFLGDADNDTLDGGGGNDVLVGGAGADTMLGRAGNDTFVVNETGDVVNESGGSGIDTVVSVITFSLANTAKAIGAIEALTLSGAAALNGTGNNFANTLSGNGAANVLAGGIGNDILRGFGGNDTLIGGHGIDTLTGGANNDFFVFSAPLNIAHRDVITDFANVAGNNDTIRLENAVMPQIGGPGALNAAFFRVGAVALDANDRIVYNKTTGGLFFDANGNGAGGVTQLATLTTKPTLAAGDFVVI